MDDKINYRRNQHSGRKISNNIEGPKIDTFNLVSALITQQKLSNLGNPSEEFCRDLGHFLVKHFDTGDFSNLEALTESY